MTKLYTVVTAFRNEVLYKLAISVFQNFEIYFYV